MDPVKNELTMEDLKKLMNEIATGTVNASVKEQLAAFKAENDAQIEKQLFAISEGPVQDGFRKTVDGSVINTKALAQAVAAGAGMSNADFGQMVLSSGGFFQKLSPAMETFGKMLKAKMNPGHMGNMGIDLQKYREMCLTQMKTTHGMNEAVGADGGFTVPVEYSSTMIEFAIQMSNILSRVWRVPMRSATAKWPRLAQTDDSFFGGFQVHWIGEGVVKPEEKVALEQLTFTAHKAAKIIPLTDELIEDSLLNIVNYCMALGTRAYMYELEHCVIDGTGVAQPLGISNDPIVVANAVARQAAGAVSWRDLLNLEGAMNENFRNLEWIMRRHTLSHLRNALDANNTPAWRETWGSFNGTPTMTPTNISYPYHITRNASDLGHRGDIILGDLGFYMLAVRKDMTIDVSPYPYWTTDETCIRFVARVDGKPGSSYAFKMLGGTGS